MVLSLDESINAEPANLAVAGVDIAFASARGDRAQAIETAHDLIAQGAGTAVITRGENGALAVYSSHFVEVGAALACGARVAARTCEHAGGFSQ